MDEAASLQARELGAGRPDGHGAGNRTIPEPTADDRSGLDHATLVGGQRLDAGRQQPADRVRAGDEPSRIDHLGGPLSQAERPAVVQEADRFLDVQRVAFRSPRNGAGQRGREPRRLEDLANEASASIGGSGASAMDAHRSWVVTSSG